MPVYTVSVVEVRNGIATIQCPECGRTSEEVQFMEPYSCFSCRCGFLGVLELTRDMIQEDTNYICSNFCFIKKLLLSYEDTKDIEGLWKNSEKYTYEVNHYNIMKSDDKICINSRPIFYMLCLDNKGNEFYQKWI